MALMGEVFAERNISGKKRRVTQKPLDFSEIACTEFGTLPRETIIRLGLRHVYTMPVVLEGISTQVLIYRAELLWRKKWRTVYVQESEDEADEGWHKLPWFVSPLLWFCSLLGFVLFCFAVLKVLSWTRR